MEFRSGCRSGAGGPGYISPSDLNWSAAVRVAVTSLRLGWRREEACRLTSVRLS
jgi:hypothetical protein